MDLDFDKAKVAAPNELMDFALHIMGEKATIDSVVAKSIDWIVMPIVIAPLLDRELAKALTRVMTAHNHGDLWCFDAKNITNGEAMRIPVDIESMLDWSVSNTWSDWILLPESKRFCLMCFGVDNTNLICGPRLVAENLLGLTAMQAVTDYRNYLAGIRTSFVKEHQYWSEITTDYITDLEKGRFNSEAQHRGE